MCSRGSDTLSTNEVAVQTALRHFGLDVTEARPVAESYSSTVRILTLAGGDKLVLKIPFARYKLLRESAMLALLQDMLPVPRLIDRWQGDEGVPGALLLSFLPGEPANGPVSLGLARGMGALLAQMHRVRLARFGELDPSLPRAGGWWESLHAVFQRWQPLCAGVLPAALYERAVARYAQLSAHLPDPDGPCATHWDYRPGNVLVRQQQITGLIDFESARGGSADLDFTKIKKAVWDVFPGTREAFLDGYTSVRPLPPIEETLPLYELGNAFGGIAWCVRRGKQRDPFFDRNLSRLKELVAD
jgi:Ser/Thr protein kinase RdoA (MazF antagonist)